MNLVNWMRDIPGSLLISQISIPGTHDSGTYKADSRSGAGFVKTQVLSIADQLLAGCRFLDIRGRLFGNALTLHHGEVYLNLNFDDVLGFCQTFLESNPTECVLMSLKEEHTRELDTITYEQAVQNYIRKNPSLWYTADRLPALDGVRGKIVLLRRFALDQDSAPLGIPLELGDNTSGSSPSCPNPPETLYYEDRYNPDSTAQKKDAILGNIGLAQANANPGNLYLTFTSGYKSPFTTPAKLAKVINPWFSGVISHHRNLGMLAVDFITHELCIKIITPG
jgi:1-phosphatidylinositol phosphodiesterase